VQIGDQQERPDHDEPERHGQELLGRHKRHGVPDEADQGEGANAAEDVVPGVRLTSLALEPQEEREEQDQQNLERFRVG